MAALTYFKLANLLAHELVAHDTRARSGDFWAREPPLPAKPLAQPPTQRSPPDRDARVAQVAPPLLTLAEEHSVLPGLTAPVGDGGVGFDYRQAMGLPPLWERLASAPAHAPIDMRACAKRPLERGWLYSFCRCS